MGQRDRGHRDRQPSSSSCTTRPTSTPRSARPLERRPAWRPSRQPRAISWRSPGSRRPRPSVPGRRGPVRRRRRLVGCRPGVAARRGRRRTGRAIACTTSRSSTRSAASAARPCCSSQFEGASASLVAMIGDLIIVDDDDERLMLDCDGRVPRRGRPRGRRRRRGGPSTAPTSWSSSTIPTDVFGDLADALAEAYPSVAPELAADGEADDAEARWARRRRRRLTPTGRRRRHGRVERGRAQGVTMRLVGSGAGREPGDPAGPVAAVVPRSGSCERLARGPVRPCPPRRPVRAWSCGVRSRSTPRTPLPGIVTIHFRVVGRGTDWFTRLRPGDTIDMLGPLGRPFEVDPRSQHLLLVAGGLGIAGVRMLADEAIRDGSPGHAPVRGRIGP